MHEHTELDNLDGLTSEVRDVRAALADLTAALDEVVTWSQTLPDRWAGAEGTTAGLDNAVRSIAEMAAGLKLPPAVLEQLAVLEQEATRARGVGEVAGDVDATGDLAAFTADAGPAAGAGIDHGGDQDRRERVVEQAIRQAYDMLVINGEEDGREVRWVGLVALRAQLDEDAAHAGRLPFPRAGVDAGLQRLSRLPGIHLQGEANQQTLTDADWEAGVRFGGSTRHILLIEGGA